MLNSKEAWESDRKDDVGEERALNPPGFSFSGDEKVSLNLNSDCVTSGGEDVSGVSMHVDENAGNIVSAGSVSLVVDFRGPVEARVSDGSDDVNEFRVCEIKSEDEKLGAVSSNGISELESENKLDLVSDGNQKVEIVSKVADSFDAQNGKLDRKEHHQKVNVDDYDSMLSMFDKFAANGKSGAVGYGYEIGDMVWGKVKSHPWWPGHIYSESFASSSVRRTKREGHVLVAFFGDNSYGWFDPAELIPFETNFAEKSKQTTSRTFLKAVEEAVDEVNRRSSMALSCRCRNPFNFWPTDVDDYFVAYEAGIYSASQIKKARDNFQPGVMIDFVKQLACSPMSGINEIDSINFIQNMSVVLAFRKAVFEEFDETYAQAFGAHPVRPVPPTTPLEPSKAPLSGRQVFAETLGKGKSSGKSHKLKDQVEKDQYLFKRREELGESKTPNINLPSQSDVSVVPVKGPHSGGVSSASFPSLSNMAEGLDNSANQPVTGAALHGEDQIHNNAGGSHLSMVTDVKTLGDGFKMHTDRGLKKMKLQKRLPGDINSESSIAVQKPKKKKKVLGTQSFDHTKAPAAAVSKGGAVSGKVEKSVPCIFGENTHVNHHQGNHVVATTPLLPDSLGIRPVVGDKEIQHELPHLLNDLQALALNPFHGAERCCPAIIRDVFLKFRSVVYQKSLPSLASAENESKEARPSALTTLTPSLENLPMENAPSAKPPKPSNRPEDPTKGGRKRGPSDRQEEMTAKKKKKIDDLKLLAAEKRVGQKMPEGQRDGKETGGKKTGQMLEKKNMQRSGEVQRGDPRDMGGKSMALIPARGSGSESARKRQLPVRAANPTMLVMKFSIGAALPSSSELKAKFARFGPLDHSGTRIFWKSFTCRLVYQHKIDAQAALKFATSTSNLFGNTNVKCHIREMPVETPEIEPSRVQKEDGLKGASHSFSSRDSPAVVQHRVGASSIQQPMPMPVQLKSCLKKPSSSDDGGNGNVRGRVKFMLGGEGSSKTIADDDGMHSPHGLNYNTEKIHMVVPPSSSSSSSSILPLPTSTSTSIQFSKAPNNYQHTEILSRNVQNFSSPAGMGMGMAMPMPGSPTNIDITQQMLSLLTRCKDVVNNLTGVLGYVPYHPL